MLVLASASKARKNLLEQVGINHKVILSNVSEDGFSFNSLKELVQRLAIEKAETVATKITSLDFVDPLKDCFIGVLGCDSLFEFNGGIFGKPKNTKEAFDRWKMMSGSTGIIHTGHCLKFRKGLRSNLRSNDFNSSENIVISTKVHFSKLSELEIQRYVNSEEPFNCAGGFSIDGKGGIFIERIEGCYSNVIGLSLPWLRLALRKAKINYQ